MLKGSNYIAMGDEILASWVCRIEEILKDRYEIENPPIKFDGEVVLTMNESCYLFDVKFDNKNILRGYLFVDGKVLCNLFIGKETLLFPKRETHIYLPFEDAIRYLSHGVALCCMVDRHFSDLLKYFHNEGLMSEQAFIVDSLDLLDILPRMQFIHPFEEETSRFLFVDYNKIYPLRNEQDFVALREDLVSLMKCINI